MKCIVDGITFYAYPPRRPRFYAPRDGKLLWLHRYVWEKVHGLVPPGKCIHHIDENPRNNALENLACLTGSQHRKAHLTPKVLAQLDRARELSLVGRWKPAARQRASEAVKKRMEIERKDAQCMECGRPIRALSWQVRCKRAECLRTYWARRKRQRRLDIQNE